MVAGPGICFDVDGVLYHGSAKHAIPGAKAVINSLWNKAGVSPQIKIPHVFLTNGTGFTEQQKAEELAEMLDLPISSKQIVMASTPMQELAREFGHQRVLGVARSASFTHTLLQLYGFKNIVAVQEYAQRHPILFPQKIYPENAVSTDSEPPIAAVLLLQTPSDWGEALQVCLDILRSNGTPLSHANDDPQQTVKLFSGNPDLDYQALHAVPRLTLGAFRICLEKLFRESTGRQLRCDGLYGKPFPDVYTYAQRSLQAQANEPITSIYAIGDNPVSDIAGANAAGENWYSILVRTGCFHGEDNDPTFPARFVCDDVTAAWAHIASREGLDL